MTVGFGFEAIPDELRQAADKIDDVLGRVLQLPWRGPTGDYGHSGVQQCWAEFVENAKREVESLRDKAVEHGESLRRAALAYLEQETESHSNIAGLGDLIDGGGLDPSMLRTGGIGLGSITGGQTRSGSGGLTGTISDALTGNDTGGAG